MEELFAKTKEAYDHLSNDAKRAEYDARLSRPKETSRPKPLSIVAQAEHCFKQGIDAYNTGEFKQAADLFEAAARLIPDDHRYFGHLGKTLLHFPERLRRAEMAFREAVTFRPDEVEYYMELARLYERQGLLRRALKEYEEALKRNPENSVLREAFYRKIKLIPAASSGVFKREPVDGLRAISCIDCPDLAHNSQSYFHCHTSLPLWQNIHLSRIPLPTFAPLPPDTA